MRGYHGYEPVEGEDSPGVVNQESESSASVVEVPDVLMPPVPATAVSGGTYAPLVGIGTRSVRLVAQAAVGQNDCLVIGNAHTGHQTRANGTHTHDYIAQSADVTAQRGLLCEGENSRELNFEVHGNMLYNGGPDFVTVEWLQVGFLRGYGEEGHAHTFVEEKVEQTTDFFRRIYDSQPVSFGNIRRLWLQRFRGEHLFNVDFTNLYTSGTDILTDPDWDDEDAWLFTTFMEVSFPESRAMGREDPLGSRVQYNNWDFQIRNSDTWDRQGGTSNQAADYQNFNAIVDARLTSIGRYADSGRLLWQGWSEH